MKINAAGDGRHKKRPNGGEDHAGYAQVNQRDVRDGTVYEADRLGEQRREELARQACRPGLSRDSLIVPFVVDHGVQIPEVRYFGREKETVEHLTYLHSQHARVSNNTAISQRAAQAVNDQYRLVSQIIGDQEYNDDQNEARVRSD